MSNQIDNDAYAIIGRTLTNSIRHSIMSASDETFAAIKRGMDEWIDDQIRTELGERVIVTMRNFVRVREESSSASSDRARRR
jgi:hypothetical protein